METYQLVNGVKIPKLGFGTWQLEEGDEAYNSIRAALDVGYTHIDTAQVYGNEPSVGRAIQDSGIAREDLFVTTKVWNDKETYQATLDSMEESLQKLQMDYVDLVLIHWPNPQPLRVDRQWVKRNAEVWKALEELYKEGKVKAIGVSNFMERHFDALLETATITPMINQILLAPGADLPELVKYYTDQDVLIQAYSPLGSGEMLDKEEIQAVAQEVDRTVPQVAIRWSLEHGYNPLPRSRNKDHIISNFQVFDFELSQSQMERLDAMEPAKEQPDPDHRPF